MPLTGSKCIRTCVGSRRVSSRQQCAVSRRLVLPADNRQDPVSPNTGEANSTGAGQGGPRHLKLEGKCGYGRYPNATRWPLAWVCLWLRRTMEPTHNAIQITDTLRNVRDGVRYRVVFVCCANGEKATGLNRNTRGVEASGRYRGCKAHLTGAEWEPTGRQHVPTNGTRETPASAHNDGLDHLRLR